MPTTVFSPKELSAIMALAVFPKGRAIASQVETETGLSALTISQIFHNNETYVQTVGTINKTVRGHTVNLYGLTNEGWGLVQRRKRICMEK